MPTPCRITFQHDRTITVPAGTLLLDAASQAGYELRTHCGGNGTCGKCQLIVNQQKRLACQTLVQSDLDVAIPPQSRPPQSHNPSHSPSRDRIASRPQFPDCGTVALALDIGTTMLAAESHDLTGSLPFQTASRPNPQRKFGDDVISRIQKIMQDETTLPEMQRLLVDAINDMIAELAEKMGVNLQNITHIVAAGNTVMQSLLFGIDPSPLGTSPFQPPVKDFPPRLGREMGLNISGMVRALPIFGGFVGGDVVAGMLAIQQTSRKRSEAQFPDHATLFLDIGTNGEIVLAHQGKLVAAATAAGPAFEGAKIECGTQAGPGAIECVNIESGKITVSTIGNRPAVGICGSGLIDAAAALLELGILQPNGRFADGKNHFELVSQSESGLGEAIVLTQRDVRELQLATGAIRAGITLLLREYGLVPEDIGTFYVSGGFGQSIRLASAQRIGLLPSIPLERFVFCGNTSLAGARLVLLNPDNADVARQLVERSQHCDLALLPRFQEEFAASLRFAGQPTLDKPFPLG